MTLGEFGASPGSKKRFRRCNHSCHARKQYCKRYSGLLPNYHLSYSRIESTLGFLLRESEIYCCLPPLLTIGAPSLRCFQPSYHIVIDSRRRKQKCSRSPTQHCLVEARPVHLLGDHTAVTPKTSF